LLCTTKAAAPVSATKDEAEPELTIRPMGSRLVRRPLRDNCFYGFHADKNDAI